MPAYTVPTTEIQLSPVAAAMRDVVVELAAERGARVLWLTCSLAAHSLWLYKNGTLQHEQRVMFTPLRGHTRADCLPVATALLDSQYKRHELPDTTRVAVDAVTKGPHHIAVAATAMLDFLDADLERPEMQANVREHLREELGAVTFTLQGFAHNRMIWESGRATASVYVERCARQLYAADQFAQGRGLRFADGSLWVPRYPVAHETAEKLAALKEVQDLVGLEGTRANVRRVREALRIFPRYQPVTLPYRPPNEAHLSTRFLHALTHIHPAGQLACVGQPRPTNGEGAPLYWPQAQPIAAQPLGHREPLNVGGQASTEAEEEDFLL